MKLSIKLMLSVSTLAMSTVGMTATVAQDKAPVLEELTVIGSRSTKPRSAADSPVPVDVISGSMFNSMGNAADITDNLKALVPSFTASPATGDGSAFVRPTSLRGTAPDQTLVLVNGKRRHRSALVHFFAPAAGNGAHGSDIGMIPSMALKRVEVLRDGAASQYGSDAIAGVINFVTNDANEGGQVTAQYGEFYRGEFSLKLAGNAGFKLGDEGFANFTIEYTDNQALSRGIQRPDAAALTAGGIQGVGSDTPFGDAPLVQSWGRPETSGTRMFLNTGIAATDDIDLYFQANYAETDGRYRFFYRDPGHSTITALENDFGWTSTLPAGFTPYLDGAQTDYSYLGGMKGEFGDGIKYDLSASYGKNELDYFLNNTLNGSLAPVAGVPQRDFDTGGYAQKEMMLNSDFSKEVSDTVNVAWGMEYRKETYVVVAGEPNAALGGGASGMKGISASDAGSYSRKNVAAYVDIEHDISEKFMMQYAARYEYFNDFGSTINGKLAGRYRASDTITVRGAISTGFHAPTPGQANVQTIITTFDGLTGLQVEEGLVPASSPAAVAVGGAPLKEETAINYSLGMSAALGNNTSLTVDAYMIDVDDRIYRTGDIAVPGSTSGATISFYTNALNMRHKGVDVVLTSSHDWNSEMSTDISLAANFNSAKVRSQTPVGTIIPVSAATVEDIENNYPKTRFVLTANTRISDKWSVMHRANFYGAHYDERGTIAGGSAKIGSEFFFDAELNYDFEENIRFTFGASNIFNNYVDTIGAANPNRLSVGLPYPRRSAANYEGGSWYFRLGYTF